MVKPTRGLGRGIDALFSVDIAEDINQNEIDIDKIIPRSDQPRQTFTPDSMAELAESIKIHGILQPILVRPLDQEKSCYEIVAGERRWRAAQQAGLKKIPAIVKIFDEQTMAEAALIENLQRDDLNIIEEARAYQQVLDKFGYTQETLAERIGKSRVHITNTLRLLKLPVPILDLLKKGILNSGQGRALLSLSDEKIQLQIANEVVEKKLNVRDTENKVREINTKQSRKSKTTEWEEVEERLEKHFSTKTKIIPIGKGGKIEINFYSLEELERLLEVFHLE